MEEREKKSIAHTDLLAIGCDERCAWVCVGVCVYVSQFQTSASDTGRVKKLLLSRICHDRIDCG